MAAACVDISRRQVVQALMVALMVVVSDEGCDVRFEITWQEVVLQQDAVLECLMPSSPLAGRRCKQRREAILP